jgi:four helix bundle protein
MMNKEFDLRKRTKEYALAIINLCSILPNIRQFNIIQNQLLRSGTSVGAQYREACRAKSDADMISKFEGVLQELDETDYWLDLLFELSENHKQTIEGLRTETNELLSIFTASVRTIKNKKNN